MKASYEPGKVKATSANWVNGYANVSNQANFTEQFQGFHMKEIGGQVQVTFHY
jgi:hypothetical protein